jgi:hypothetical protein
MALTLGLMLSSVKTVACGAAAMVDIVRWFTSDLVTTGKIPDEKSMMTITE